MVVVWLWCGCELRCCWLFSVRQEALCDILTFYGGSFVIAPHKTPLKQDHIVLSSSYNLRSSLLDNVPNVAQKNSILGTQV